MADFLQRVFWGEIMKKLFFLLISLIALSCSQTNAYKLAKQVSINLKEVDNKVIIDFCNKTNKEIFIPNYYLFDDKLLFNDYFIVLDNNNCKAEYLGIIGDFWQVENISIPKCCKITKEIALEDFYEIQSNKVYKVQYSFSGLESNCIDYILQE